MGQQRLLGFPLTSDKTKKLRPIFSHFMEAGEKGKSQ
jgi:hypothetical protein